MPRRSPAQRLPGLDVRTRGGGTITRRENVVSKGITREQIEEVWAKGGQLSRAELLHCRIRYFTKGAAIGSKAYLKSVIHPKDCKGPHRCPKSRKCFG